MMLTVPFMYGKIHRCTVTGADLNYVGSITIDPLLLVAARIHPYVQVDVVNITNGARLQTYVIAGELGKGEIILNGAAAHQFHRGDLAIIMAYSQMPLETLVGSVSRSVQVDNANKIIEVREYEVPSLEALARGEAASRSGERFTDLVKT
ncbi:MAG: aspartate 1-decarboxylase [Burkholderiales bacterium]|nr:aspartate 1-decarboxylase [Burkholderiales bacterium]